MYNLLTHMFVCLKFVKLCEINLVNIKKISISLNTSKVGISKVIKEIISQIYISN